MAQTSSILLNAGDRERLTALVADRNRPHKHVQRARIILCSDERLPVLHIAKRVGVSRPAVWRWQQRFAEEGVEGLLRDKTRPPGKPPVPPETVAQVLAITCSEPPGEVTHWTGRAVAERVGLALRTIQRIWRAHRVEPHRVPRYFDGLLGAIHQYRAKAGTFVGAGDYFRKVEGSYPGLFHS